MDSYLEEITQDVQIWLLQNWQVVQRAVSPILARIIKLASTITWTPFWRSSRSRTRRWTRFSCCTRSLATSGPKSRGSCPAAATIALRTFTTAPSENTGATSKKLLIYSKFVSLHHFLTILFKATRLTTIRLWSWRLTSSTSCTDGAWCLPTSSASTTQTASSASSTCCSLFMAGSTNKKTIRNLPKS